MDLLEFESVADPSEAGAGGDPAAEPVEATPEVTPEPAAAEPSYLTADQAAEIADARFNALLAQLDAAEPTPTPGEPVDMNELLNPLAEGYGENFANYLARRDEWILSQFEERLTRMVGPVTQTFEAQAAERNELALDAAIAEQTKDTGIPASASGAIKVLARSYYPQLAARFGPNGGAAAAMSQAIKEINAVVSESGRAGGATNAQQLASLAAANAEPGGPGAVSEPEAGSVEEALARFKARNNARLAAA